MPIHKSTLYIHKKSFGCQEDFAVMETDMSQYGYILLGTHDFEVEYPTPTKDPVEAEIEGLQKQVAIISNKAMADTEILTRRINELKCIEYKPEDK